MTRLRSAVARAIWPSWRGVLWGLVMGALWVQGMTLADVGRTAKHWPVALRSQLQQMR